MAKLDQSSITAAALAVIQDDDSEVTLAAISRKLGVTQPALYYHVQGIEDIWRWTGIAIRTELVQVLTQATIGLSRADAVRAVAAAWRTYSQAHSAHYLSTNWHPVEGDAELEAAVGQVLAVLASSLRSFDLDAEQQAHAALALRSTLHGFVSFELGAGNPSPQTADESFTHVIELLITGVEALAAGTISRLAS